jgi:hypothetical protein
MLRWGMAKKRLGTTGLAERYQRHSDLTLRSRSSSKDNVQEFSAYLKENTILHHYKDQLVNAV